MSIEGIALEHLSEPTHTETGVTPQSRTRHAVFYPFLSDDRKQDSSAANAHSKYTIELLKQRNIVLNKLSTIWENIYGCAEH